MKRQAIFLARWAGRGAFKATALVLAFVIIMALWLWNASLLTTAADQNLRIIKTLTQLLPPDGASKAESALRIFGADRALLLVEGIAIAKLKPRRPLSPPTDVSGLSRRHAASLASGTTSATWATVSESTQRTCSSAGA